MTKKQLSIDNDLIVHFQQMCVTVVQGFPFKPGPGPKVRLFLPGVPAMNKNMILLQPKIITKLS